MTTRALILGGGVVGLATALAFARRGVDVTLVEADRSRSAPSWGNAGHIAIEQVAPLSSRAALRSVPRRLFVRGGALAFPPAQWRHWLPFGARLLAASGPRRFAAGQRALASLLAEALPAWRRLDASLPGSRLLREDGHFVAWGDPAAARRGRAAWASVDTGESRIRDVTAAERAALAALSAADVDDAIRFDGTAHIADLNALADRLDEALAAAGVRRVHGRAEIGRDGSVRVDGHILPADMVVVTAGVRSASLLRPLGHRVPIIAERGYHLRSHDHDWPAEMPPVVFEDRSMIVTRFRDCVQVASFVELGDADAAPDPAKWARLERHVAALGLPIRPPFVRWMGPRPTLPDYLPAIGRSLRAPRLHYAFGHQHLGLTLAALTGELVAADALGSGLAIDLAPFDIERFGGRRP